MKKAVIVVGKLNAEKSTTIRKFKRMVKMESFHVFRLKGKLGYILSTSFEETGRDIEATVKKLSGYDFWFLHLKAENLNVCIMHLKNHHTLCMA